MEKVSRLRRLNRSRRRLRRRTATETVHDATASCRSTPLAGCARSAIAAPVRLRRTYAIPLPPHFACFLLEARKHAKCYVVGDVHRSTPCRVRRKCAVTFVPSHFLHERARRSAAWLVKPTRIQSSPLTRLAHPVPASASGLCHRTCLKPSSAPSPPAHPEHGLSS